ncbi:metallophosphoesterase [Halococcus sp. IIIV-5B]|uniref:metallophosphoesterase family protein n=1 Tax=Halococcus sp. IIIV-5B TaxID=2321230 RepID=UPI000E765EF1|nr:metallophosphoesterase [Halococcus sp. IIIV-5B]RJT04899.1 serine/threonine protein phosphatase [Halococcus sp. IIIV-5B]
MHDAVRGEGLVLARFARPTARSTTLAVVADPHVTPVAEGTWKVFHRTEARLRGAVASANRLGVDAVVSTGDLTKDGAPAEFDRVDSILDDLDAPFVAVPGNHDVPKAMDDHETPPVERFAKRYGVGTLPYVIGVGGVDLVGIDTATDESLFETHEGAVSADQLAWLDSVLDGCETPVVVCHHPVGRVAERVDALAPSSHYRLRNADALVEVLADHDVGLVLSGHVHWPAVDRVGGVRQAIAPAACSFPPAALLVHVEPRGTTVSLLPLVGRRGLEEAYRHVGDQGRGAAFVAAAEDGYFRGFPQVDESDDGTALRPRDPPGAPARSPSRGL